MLRHLLSLKNRAGAERTPAGLPSNRASSVGRPQPPSPPATDPADQPADRLEGDDGVPARIVRRQLGAVQPSSSRRSLTIHGPQVATCGWERPRHRSPQPSLGGGSSPSS
jgi:hypothetical protein